MSMSSEKLFSKWQMVPKNNITCHFAKIRVWIKSGIYLMGETVDNYSQNYLLLLDLHFQPNIFNHEYILSKHVELKYTEVN